MPVAEEGFETAEAQAQAASSFHRVSTLRMKDGEVRYLRFISERIFTFDMHMGIPTKPQPKEVKGDKWPKLMWATCQNGKPFRLRDAAGNVLDEYEPGYGECHVHVVMKGKKDDFGKDKSVPRVQSFGLAVLREPVLDPVTREATGFRDVTEEFKDAEGVVHTIPKVVIVQQTYSNFWAPLKASMFLGSRTLCNRDFEVTRKDKDYLFGNNVTPDLAPGTPAWSRYERTLELLGNFDLFAQIVEWSTPDWYKRWFIEGATPEGGYGRQGDDDEGEAAQEAEGGTAVGSDALSQEEVDDFRASMRAGRS